jgi:hypothetical protein
MAGEVLKDFGLKIALPSAVEPVENPLITIPQGNLNHMLPVSFNGELHLLRIPRSRESIASTVTALEQEYAGLGYFALGGRYRLRNLREQVKFARLCADRGVAVAAMQQVNGLTLVKYESALKLSRINITNGSDTEAAVAFLKTIVSAHEKGLVLGDRWTPNVLVKSSGEIVNIDFDIELTGLVSHEFELAQAIHYGSHSVSWQTWEAVDRWYRDGQSYLSTRYNLPVVNYFLHAHQLYQETHLQMNPYSLCIANL